MQKRDTLSVVVISARKGSIFEPDEFKKMFTNKEIDINLIALRTPKVYALYGIRYRTGR